MKCVCEAVTHGDMSWEMVQTFTKQCFSLGKLEENLMFYTWVKQESVLIL